MPQLDLQDGASLYYETHGKGPALVFAHGLGGNHASWWQQVPAFAGRYTCITIAHRGFTPSHDPAGMPDPARYAEDLEALLAHLKIEEVRLVGQSMGGWTMVDFALRHPGRVKALVLSSTIGTIDGARLPGMSTEALAKWDAWAKQERERLEAAGWYPPTGERMGRDQPALDLLYRQIGGMAAGFDRHEMRRRLIKRRTVAPDALAALGFPVLCVIGLEDVVINPVLGRALAGALPRGELEVLADSGHSPYFEHAARFNKRVSEFLGST
jgi:3-oxoadipate enol-lactonase